MFLILMTTIASAGTIVSTCARAAVAMNIASATTAATPSLRTFLIADLLQFFRSSTPLYAPPSDARESSITSRSNPSNGRFLQSFGVFIPVHQPASVTCDD